MNRGVDFTEPRLYVLDGGKALHAAVKKHAGDAAPIQRERQVGSGPIVANNSAASGVLAATLDRPPSS
jgi:hypothetical protein